MSNLKDLFRRKRADRLLENASLNKLGSSVESADYVDSAITDKDQFVPHVDFTSASNFAIYGSAEQYYSDSINYITNEYPYDGSRKEKIEWALSGTYLDRYIFEEEYPRTTGYVNMAQTYGAVTQKTDGYDSAATVEYINFFGGPTTSSAGMESGSIAVNFTSSNIYNTASQGTSNLELNGNNGVSFEFWLKKPSFNFNYESRKQVIFDIWNSASYGTDSYGRFRVELTGTNATLGTVFNVELMSGTAGLSSGAALSGTTVSLTSDSALTNKWNHFALTFINSGSNMQGKLYRNGTLQNTITTGTPMEKVTGSMLGQVGALVAVVSGNYDSETAGLGHQGDRGLGKLSASLDEVRFWKTKRTDEQIGQYWFTNVYGGTNTDITLAPTASTKYSYENPVDLGVYYKFNEGIMDATEVVSQDKIVLDYAGRLVNGQWYGYTTGSRSTGSAIVESNAASSEFKDPILYVQNPEVLLYSKTKEDYGRHYDALNNSSLYYSIPEWILSDDQNKSSGALKKLTQIMGSYFDTLQMQIKSVPEIQNKTYLSGTDKPFPFIDKMIDSSGLITSEIFSKATELEYLASRNNLQEFTAKIDETKNIIYKNIYNNLVYLYKSKGTQKAFRNLIRCFGIDDELVKINLYADNATYKLKDNYEFRVARKRYVNFHSADKQGAIVFQQSSSTNNNSRSYLFSTASVQFRGNTYESEMIFPPDPKPGYTYSYSANYVTSSLFGCHTSGSDTLNEPWATDDVAQFLVQTIRPDARQPHAYFRITGSVIPEVTTSVFKDVYDDSRWNIAVKVRPQSYPWSDGVTGSSILPYIVEMVGYNYELDTAINSFAVTGTMANNPGSRFMQANKRFYVGANRTNFTGSVLQNCNAKISSLRVWMDDLPNDVISVHAKDVTNYGTKNPYESAYISQLSKSLGDNITFIPQLETLALDWEFESVTSSNASGQFSVADVSKRPTNYYSGPGSLYNSDCITWENLVNFTASACGGIEKSSGGNAWNSWANASGIGPNDAVTFLSSYDSIPVTFTFAGLHTSEGSAGDESLIAHSFYFDANAANAVQIYELGADPTGGQTWPLNTTDYFRIIRGNFGEIFYQRSTDSGATYLTIYTSKVRTLGALYPVITGWNSGGPGVASATVEQGIGSSADWGWLSPIAQHQYTGLGYGFPINATSSIDRRYVNTAKQMLPEVLNSSDMVSVINENEDKLFTRETRPVQYYFAFEKSMAGVISNEMIKIFSTIVDFNNLIGEPVNRYRQEYKRLGKLRQLYFDRVENTPDFDKFVEYYKWIDSALSAMLIQLAPASSKFSENLRTLIESHILERNKYWNKFPTLEPKATDPESGLQGIVELSYPWKRGHAPVDNSENTNCYWWKERADRSNTTITSGDSTIDTERESIRKAGDFFSGTLPILKVSGGATYEGNVYAIRNFTQPYKFTAQEMPNMHGGSNFPRAKTVEYAHDALKFDSSTTLSILEPDIAYEKGCNDVIHPNAKERLESKIVNSDDPDGYDTGKGTIFAPFSLFSSSIETGYALNVATNFRAKTGIDNYHEDIYGDDKGIPIQSPFTEKHVGGRQHRHIDINTGSFDTNLTRPEAWNLDIDLANQKSIEFDGTDDYILIPSASGISAGPGHGDFSFETWIYETSEVASDVIILRGTSTAGWGLYHYFGTSLRFHVGGNYVQIDSDPNEWVHWVGTYNSTTNLLSLYKNAAAPTSTAAGASHQVSNNPIKVGAGLGSSYWQGRINQIGMWNRELSQEEVTALYNDGCPVDLRNAETKKTPILGLTNWWRMGDGDTYPTIIDVVGGVNGTMTDMSADDIAEQTPCVPTTASLSLSPRLPIEPRATMIRDEYAKRPVNIRNIKWGTSSQVAGNFRKNYEIFQTSGRLLNNRFFIENGGFTPPTSPSPYISGVIDFLLPRYDLTGSTQSIIVERFSAPGGPEVMSRGALDLYAEEYSVFNEINQRNRIVRDALDGWYTEYCGQFGISPTGSPGGGTFPAEHRVNSSSYGQVIASYHKVNRNPSTVRRFVDWGGNNSNNLINCDLSNDGLVITSDVTASNWLAGAAGYIAIKEAGALEWEFVSDVGSNTMVGLSQRFPVAGDIESVRYNNMNHAIYLTTANDTYPGGRLYIWENGERAPDSPLLHHYTGSVYRILRTGNSVHYQRNFTGNFETFFTSQVKTSGSHPLYPWVNFNGDDSSIRNALYTNVDYDNWFIQHAIPQTTLQYKWINDSFARLKDQPEGYVTDFTVPSGSSNSTSGAQVQFTTASSWEFPGMDGKNYVVNYTNIFPALSPTMMEDGLVSQDQEISASDYHYDFVDSDRTINRVSANWTNLTNLGISTCGKKLIKIGGSTTSWDAYTNSSIEMGEKGYFEFKADNTSGNTFVALTCLSTFSPPWTTSHPDYDYSLWVYPGGTLSAWENGVKVFAYSPGYSAGDKFRIARIGNRIEYQYDNGTSGKSWTTIYVSKNPVSTPINPAVAMYALATSISETVVNVERVQNLIQPGIGYYRSGSIFGVSGTINAYLNNLNGPYGYPSWKQIRTVDHPIVRRNNQKNIISTRDRVGVINLQNPDGGGNLQYYGLPEIARVPGWGGSVLRADIVGTLYNDSVTNYIEPPVSFNRPLETTMQAQGARAFTLRHTFGNNKEMFSQGIKHSRSVADALGVDNQKQTIEMYDKILASNQVIKSLNYKEIIYPRDALAGLAKSRGRLNYTEISGTGPNGIDRPPLTRRTFWRNSIGKRRRNANIVTSSLNSMKIVDVQALSVWPMESQFQPLTGGMSGTILRKDADTWNVGELNKAWPGLPRKYASKTNWALFVAEEAATASQYYCWNVAPLIRSDITIDGRNRSIPTEGGGGGHCGTDHGFEMIPTSPSTMPQWWVSAYANKDPWFDSYEEYISDIRSMAQNYTILPEFKISDHMEFYINEKGGNFRARTDKFLSLDGAEISSSAKSTGSQFGSRDFNQSFFNTYSHTNFLKYFEFFNKNTKNNKITLRCNVVKKLLPYNGFYPITRCLQLGSLLSQSFASNLSLYGGGWINGTPGTGVTGQQASINASRAIQAFIQPFYAPGIMYNTIKAGVAMDWATYTGSAPPANDGGALVGSWLQSGSDFRLPFESLITPQDYLPIGSSSFDATNRIQMIQAVRGDLSTTSEQAVIWGGDYSSLYSMAAHNFFAESVEFFLEGEKLKSISSVPESQFKTMIKGRTYFMDVLLDKDDDLIMWQTQWTGSTYTLGFTIEDPADNAGAGLPDVTFTGSTYGDFYAQILNENLIASGCTSDDVAHSHNNYAFWAPNRKGEYWGPPINAMQYEIERHNSDQITAMKRVYPMASMFAPYAPAYYYGQSVGRLSMTAEETRKYSLNEIMSACKLSASYFNRAFGFINLQDFTTDGDGNVISTDIGDNGTPMSWTGSYVGGYPGPATVTIPNSDADLFYQTDPYVRENDADDERQNLSKSAPCVATATQITASLTLFGQGREFQTEYIPDRRNPKQFTMNKAITPDNTVFNTWVIGTKFETPVLNFIDQPIPTVNIPAGNDNPLTGASPAAKASWAPFGLNKDWGTPTGHAQQGLGGIARGMWSGYGRQPKENEAIRMSLSYPFSGQLAPDNTGSLLDVCGFEETSLILGQTAGKKIISEAIVAIPYVDRRIRGRTPIPPLYENPAMTTNRKYFGKYFFSLKTLKWVQGIGGPRDIDVAPVPAREVVDIIQSNLRNDGLAIDEITAKQFGMAGSQRDNSISNMLESMENYVFPPEIDFLTYTDIEPFVMYVLEFTHPLDQEDLADIWQGVMPKISITAEKDMVEFSHASGPLEFYSNNTLPENVRWMVFKVKKKAATNYFAVTADQSDDERFKFDFGIGTKAPEYSYNWPYDYFSLVELAEIEVESEFKERIPAAVLVTSPDVERLP